MSIAVAVGVAGKFIRQPSSTSTQMTARTGLSTAVVVVEGKNIFFVMENSV